MDEAPAEAAPKIEGARKVVTLVFADLAGSTSLQERMDAESVRRVMDRFYDVMRGAVTGHGGTVVKFMGDGLMAAFGVPAVAEDDAVRAVRAAASMQEAFVAVAEEVAREWDAEVGLRVGVNTGEVVVAEGEDDVVGDAVNVAARLEHAAGESQILVGQETWRLTRDLFTFEEVPALDLKGKAERVPGYRLVSLTPPAAEGLSPFVGRDRELARLAEAFEAAVEERRAHLVTVVGSPGLGKSRLVRELVRRVGARARTFEGQCEASGGSTFAPVADVLRQAAGIEETASAEEAVEALAALFPDDDGDSGRITAAATTALGVGGAASPEETFWAVRRVVEQVAARQPAIVVFDDVHWAEPMLLDLLDHLAEWTRDAPVLLVALARPEIREVRPALAEAAGTPTDVLVLDALPDEEGIRLASEFLEGHPVDDDVAARLLASAEGNPLFLRELVKMLLEDGVLRLEGGVWVTAEGADVDVPPTIHALLSARIERLEADDRSVVERASVVGHQFFRGAVAVLSPPAVAARIDSHLETLRRKEVVGPEGTYWIDEPVFRFHHALIRDAAYRRLLKESRAELHEQVAEWLAAKAGDLVGEHEEAVGYHLEQAFEYRRDLGEAEPARELGVEAAGHLAAAARRSLDRDDLRAAAGLMGRAVACLPPDDTSRAELLVDRCEALLGLGEVAAGREALAELEAVSGGSPRLAAWAEAFAAEVASFSEPEALPEWVDRAAAAADLLDELGDPVGAAKSAAVHASILARLGQVGACEAALDRALAAAREAGDRRRANGVLAGAPLAALWGPSPVTRAAGRCLDVVRVLRITTDSPPVEAVALRAQGVLEAFRGRFDAARRLVGASRRTLEELGLRHGILQTDFFAGLVELAADDAGPAEAHLRTAYEGFRALGVGVDTAQAAALLARACLAQGRDDEALELTQESERLGGHDLKTAIAWRAVRAEALAARGQDDEALRLARDAVAIAAETDALVDHADARLALAMVLGAGGDADGAAAEARRAAELYEAKGATALAERAQPLAHGSGQAASPEDGDAATNLETHLSNLATAAFEAYARLVPAKDVEGIVALVAPEYELEERGRSAQTTIIGHDGVRRALEVMFEAECRIEFEVLALRGQRLSLVQVMVHVRDPLGGDTEHPFLRLDETDGHGVLVHTVTFDPDELDAAYDELDRRFVAIAGAPDGGFIGAQRVLAEAYASGDPERILDVVFASPDVEVVDHRHVGWGRVTAAEYAGFVAATTELVSVAELRRVAVFRYDPPFAVARQRLRGTGAEGEAFELVTDAVTRVEGGRITYMEMYDPEDLERALARFDELCGGAEAEPASLVAAVWEQYRDLFPRGDVDGILATVSPDYVLEERQSHAQHTSRGRDGFRKLLTTIFEVEFRRVDIETVAVRGPRLALTRVTYHLTSRAGGESEIAHLRVDEADEEGLLLSTVVFDADDLDVAFDELDRRYADHVEPSCRPILEAIAARGRALNARDWDGLRALLADDFVHVTDPLMPAGVLGEQDATALVGQLADLVAQAPDHRWYDVETLRLTPDGALHRWSGSGTGPQGIRYENVTYALEMFRAGEFWRTEIFHQSKRADALARFDELTAEQATELHAETTVLEVWERGRQATADGDLDALLAVLADDVTYEERTRSSGLGTKLEGKEAVKDVYTRIFSGDVGFPDVEVIATRGNRLLLTRATLRWSDRHGSVTDHPHLRLDETDEKGKISAWVLFDADDLDAALDELDERFCAHVDPACRPIIEASSANRRAYNARDWETMRSLLASDFVLVDHRPAGWGRLDADAYIETLQGFMPLARDVAMYSVDAGFVEPDRIFGRMVSRGTDRDGGPFEVDFDFLGYFTDGAFHRIEVFDPQQRADVLAELRDEAPNDVVEAEHDNLALMAWAKGREGMRTGDAAAILAVTTADYTYEERGRPPARFVLTGQEQLAEMLTLMLAGGAWTIDTDVIATRGARLALTHNTLHWVDPSGAATEYSSLRIDETDEAGMLTATIVFDSDDLDAAMDELDERYLGHVDPSCAPLVEVASANQRAANARDWEAMLSTVTDDFNLVDHRLAGFGERDATQWIEGIQAMSEMAPDVMAITEAVVRVAPNAILSRTKTSGSDRQGGRFEQVIDSLGILREGRLCSIELFDPAQEARARARFEALASETPDELARDNLAVAAWRRFTPLVEAKDFDAMASYYAPEYVVEGRIRSSLTRHEGRDAVLEIIEVIFGATERLDYEPLATRGRRLALGRVLEHLRDELGGDAEHEWLQVDETDEAGLMVRSVSFDPDDLDAAMDELDDRFLAHADPACLPVLQVVTTNRRAYNARDWEAFRSTLADDLVLEDHRPGWFGELGPDGYVERIRALVELSADAGMVTSEIFRVAPRAIAGRFNVGGSDPEGGTFEIVLDVVSSLADGRFRRIEFFDPSRRPDAVARFEELAAGSEGAGSGNLAIQAWEDAKVNLLAGDVEPILDVVLDDVVYEERRAAPGRFRLNGRAELAHMLTTMARNPPGAIETEVVATRGSRLVLTRNVFEGSDLAVGGDYESPLLRIDQTDATGRFAATVLFEPEALEEAFDELDERFRALLAEDDRAVFDRVVAARRAYNTHDWSAVRSLLCEDFVLVDHRPGWFGTLDRDGYLERLEGLVTVAPDASIGVADIPRLSADTAMIRWITRGTGPEGGLVEIEFDSVVVWSGDRVRRFEFFPVEEREEALARFEELAGAGSADSGLSTNLIATPNEAMRRAEEHRKLVAAGDAEAVVAHYSPSAVVEERRHSSHEVFGSEGVRAWTQWAFAGHEIVRADLDPLAIRGEHLFLGRHVSTAVDGHGGEAEFSWLVLNERNDDGLLSYVGLFEPDDLDTALEELDRRFSPDVPADCAAFLQAVLAGCSAYRKRDWEAFRSDLASDFTLVDHRPAGWGACDAGAYVERVSALVDLAPDVLLWVAEIPRLNPTAAVVRTAARGAGPEGGVVEFPIDNVITFADGEIRHIEFFPPERRDAAIARFEEVSLLAGAGRALRIWDRVVAALHENDVDSIVGLVGPAYRDHDHVLDVVTDREEQIKNQRVVAAAKGLSIEWDRVLDLERVAVVHARYRWSAGGGSGVWSGVGPGEFDGVMVVVLDDAGQITETHRFAEDQLHRALALAEDRHVEIASDPDAAAASRRFAAMWNLVDAYNRGDWDGVREMWADGLVTVDHRTAGWGTVDGRDRYVEVLEGLAEVTRDRRWIVHDLLHRGDRTLAARWSVTGTDQEGGPFEMLLLVAFAFDDDGRVIRQELFSENDSDAVLAAARGLEVEDR